MELSDLEICKRIAEIEGLDFSVESYGVFTSEFNVNYNSHESTQYDPVNKNDLCIALMEKYEIAKIVKGNIDGSKISIALDYEYYKDYPEKLDNREVLLAIIEAHKEQ